MTWSKRIYDLFFASLLVVILGPIIVWTAIWLLRVQGRPLLYGSPRMRAPDRPFTLWKFRTMTVVETDSGVSGGDKAARVTPAGAILRRRRLDEFPQLWNILKGDLSFVGPRPPLPEYVARFPDLYARVLRSRPGVTGLASLYFHSREQRLLARCTTPGETDAVYVRQCVPRKARLDLIYQRHQNRCLDFAIVFRTIGRMYGRRAQR